MSERFKRPNPERPGPNWQQRLRLRLRLAGLMLQQTFNPLPEQIPSYEGLLALPKDHVGQAAPAPSPDLAEELIWVNPHPGAASEPRCLQEAESIVEEMQARLEPTMSTEIPAYFQEIIDMGVLDRLDE